MGDGIKVVIEAQNTGAAAVNQAAQQYQRLGDEIRRSGAVASQVSGQHSGLDKTITQATTGQNLFADSARGVSEALARQAGPLGTVERALGGFNLAAGLVVGAVGALGAAFLGSAKGLGDYQEKLDLVSAATGFSVRDLSGLKIAAADTGRTFDEIRPALTIFSRKLGEAGSGNAEVSKTFSDLGVATKDSSGRLLEVGDVFRDVQGKLNEMGAGAARTAVAFDLFGRGAGASIGTLLTAIDPAIEKAQRLGLILGPAAEAAAQKSNVAFKTMGEAIEGAWLKVAAAMAPIGTKIADAITSALVGTKNSLDAVDISTRQVNREFHDAWLASLRTANGLDQATEAHKRWVNETRASSTREGGGATPFELSTQGILSGQSNMLIPGHATTGAVLGVDTKLTASQQAAREAAKALADAAKKSADDFEKSFQELVKSIRNGSKSFDAVVQSLYGNVSAIDRLRDMGFGDLGTGFGGKPLSPHGFIGPEDPNRFVGNKPMSFEPTLAQFKSEESKNTPFPYHFNDDMFKDNQERIRGLGKTLENTFASFVSAAILKTQSLEDAVKGFLEAAASAVLQTGIRAILHLQAGGTAMQSGGSIRAQTGFGLESGIRGIDSTQVSMGRGETIISHATTDMLASFLKNATRGQQATSQARPIVFSDGAIQFHGIASNQSELREFVREFMMPEVRIAISRGAA